MTIEELMDNLSLKVFNFNGTEYYHLGIKKHKDINHDRIMFYRILSRGFSRQERDKINFEIDNRKSYVVKMGLPCFLDPDDAEYIYDYIESLITMQKLLGEDQWT